MRIVKCSMLDVEAVLYLYDFARCLQTQKKMVVWPIFEKVFIEKEIQEGKQWKILLNDQTVCNWAIAFSDRQIWEERDNNDAIYIHRIATHPEFRGNRFIDKIVCWAKHYASSIDKGFVRLDTLGNNTRLIEHYVSAGFEFLGMSELKDVQGLPEHYQREYRCCRFEMKVKS